MSIGMEGCGPNPRTYSKAEYDALRAEAEALQSKVTELTNQRDAILLQARCWAGEAKTQQAITTAVGEALGGVPNWGPIAAGVEALRAENGQLRDSTKRIDAYWQSELRDCRNERDGLRTGLDEARGLLAQLRGMINCTVENDTDKIPVWISTKHPVIEQIDALLSATQAPEVQSEQGERQEAVAWAICREPGKIDALSACYASKRVAVAHAESYREEGLSLHVTPLYTAPQPSRDVRGLVEALEAISDLHASSNAVARNIARSALLSATQAQRQA